MSSDLDRRVPCSCGAGAAVPLHLHATDCEAHLAWLNAWDRTPEELATGWRTLARASPENTLAWLAGQDEALEIVDPELREQIRDRDLRLREALYREVVPALARSLRLEHETRAALLNLAQHGEAGDMECANAMAALVGRLLTWGLRAETVR